MSVTVEEEPSHEPHALNGAHAVAPSAPLMAAMLAHEIKNPLSGIRGAAQLLAQNASDKDKNLTELICREVDRINALLNKIEFFSNEPVACDQPVNIHEVLESVRPLIQESNDRIIIETQYDPSLPEVPGDYELLVQLFINLLTNASEAIANRPDGIIRIKTSYQMNNTFHLDGKDTSVSLPIAITIEDNGGGIAPDICQHLFAPFVTSKPEGKGLGLAIAAKILGEHEGMISLKPAQAGHTRFKITLPAYKASP